MWYGIHMDPGKRLSFQKSSDYFQCFYFLFAHYPWRRKYYGFFIIFIYFITVVAGKEWEILAFLFLLLVHSYEGK